MATNITIEQAKGTELVIPAAGTKRRGEVVVSANNGVFSVETDDGMKYSCLTDFNFTNAGVTITGLTPSINSTFFFNFLDSAIVKRFYGTRLGSNSSTTTVYFGNGYTSILYQTASHNTVQKTTIYGETMNCLRLAANNTNYWGTNYVNPIVTNKNSKFILSFYIESENYPDSNVILSLRNTLKFYKNGYEVWDSNSNTFSDLIAYPNNYVIPSQQWVTIEFDHLYYYSSSIFKSVSNIKFTDDSGEHLLDGVSASGQTDGSYYVYYNNGGGDTADDYVVYTHAYMFPYQAIIDTTECGQECTDRLYNIVKGLLTIDSNA